MALFVGPTRSAAICAQPQFQLNSSDPDTVRNTLSLVGTLFFWSCANQANALAYKNLANVYLYQLNLGCTNPANANDPMCVGEVCHQDDIGITFGTCTNPTSQQTALSNEIMARWAAFAKNGNPNIPGETTWNKVASSTSLNEMLFSSTDTVNQTMNAAICGPIFGDMIPFNFELY
jgi:cholinesterase